MQRACSTALFRSNRITHLLFSPQQECVTVGSYANLLRLNYACYTRFQIAGNANRNPIYFSTDKKKPSASESKGAGALFSPSSHPFLPRESPSARSCSRQRERSCLCLSVAICTRYVGRLCHELVYKSLHDDRPICDTRNPILPSWLRLPSTIVVPATWNGNCVNER